MLKLIASAEPRFGRPPRGLTAGLAALVVVVGAAGVAAAVIRSTGRAAASEGPAGSPSVSLTSGARRAGAPIRVQIPVIGVDAGLDPLGLSFDGTLEVPAYDRAGWYEGGAKPGDPGPAVIAAHVDSTTGPAVFYRLRRLVAGDVLAVHYDDGSSVDFVVTGSERYLKSQFPGEAVYGATDVPALRLITCAGMFDSAARSYRENLVVWAVASSPAS